MTFNFFFPSNNSTADACAKAKGNIYYCSLVRANVLVTYRIFLLQIFKSKWNQSPDAIAHTLPKMVLLWAVNFGRMALGLAINWISRPKCIFKHGQNALERRVICQMYYYFDVLLKKSTFRRPIFSRHGSQSLYHIGIQADHSGYCYYWLWFQSRVEISCLKVLFFYQSE